MHYKVDSPPSLARKYSLSLGAILEPGNTQQTPSFQTLDMYSSTTP